MAEEEEKPESEVLKSIKDKLAELEDMQLVNKLDIINVKNELDRASLTGGPSETSEKLEELSRLVEKSEKLKTAEKLVEELQELKSELGKGAPAGTGSMNLDPLRREIEDLRSKVAELQRTRASASGKKVEAPELQELRERTGRLEGRMKELSEMKGRIPQTEKVPSGIPKNILDRMGDIEKLSSRIESLRSQLEMQKTMISGLEKKGAPVPGPVPKELEERLNRLESGVSEMSVRHEPELPDDIVYRVKMLEEAVGDEKPRTVIAKPAKALLDRLDRLEGNMKELEAIKSRAAGKKEKAPDVEEVKSMLESIKTQVMQQGNELLDLKSLKGADSFMKIDEMREQLDKIKSHISEIEGSALKAGMAPDALEELRHLKGQFPVEEFHELKKRMNAIEQKLERLGSLAKGLKPIELPDGNFRAGGGASKQHEARIQELEKLVGEGVSGKRFKALEKRMDEMREWLPEYIANDIEHRIDDFRKVLQTKVSEVSDLKEEIIEHTIEQLLAQPGHVSKILGEKIKKQNDEIQQRLARLENIVRPSDAKLTTLLRDLDEAKRELEKEKQVLKEMQEKNRMDVESIVIDLKALNTKLSSLERTSREGGAALSVGVLRDIEILKTKADWLESTIHKFDLSEIHQKIDELEERVYSSRNYSPHVIE